MKEKLLLTIMFILAAILASSCKSDLPPSVTAPPEIEIIEPTSTPEPFVIGECDPAAELIEMNKSYNKGVGCGYTDPYFTTAMYCLWVPDGDQLKIGIKDSLSDLMLRVQRDLFEEPNTSGGWISDNIGRYQDEIVTIKNPGGRYYINVSTKTGMDCMFKDNAIVYTSAALFTIYSEFEGYSEIYTIMWESQPAALPIPDHAASLVVRKGPGDQYPPTEIQPPKESMAALVGRTPDGNWLLIEFGSTQGWVPASEVNVHGYSRIPIIQGAPVPTSTPEPCPKRIAEGILNDKVFEGLRTELNDLIKDATEKKAEDLEPIIQQMEELLIEIEGYEFSPTYSSCTQRIHAAIYNYAWHATQYFTLKYEEHTDGVSYTDEIEYHENGILEYTKKLELLFQNLLEVVEGE